MAIMDLFKDFHERGRFGKGLNPTFLVLIPKRGGGGGGGRGLERF